MIERRTYARPLYPGLLYPEEGSSHRVFDGSPIEQIAASLKDRDDQLGEWFAIEVTQQNWKLWKSEEGDEEWEPANDGSRKSYRIYIGELLTRTEVAALPGDHRMLLSNMHINGWDHVVRTRRGNFQPFNEGDVVIAVTEMST